MSPTLYSQLVHLCGIVVVAVLTATNHVSSETGLAFIAGLVGIALPSPFVTAQASTPVVFTPEPPKPIIVP